MQRFRAVVVLLGLVLFGFTARPAWGDPPAKPAAATPATTSPSSSSPSPQRGYELLLNKAYLPPDFDQETFDELWRCWPAPLRAAAEQATPSQRRHMAYERYGLIARPSDPLQRPLQYVVDAQGNWSMSCLACHQGHVAGQAIAGLPNTHFALETLTEEVRLTKLRLGKKLGRMELGSLIMPLGTTNGTTNAVMFGVVLMHYRDADLNVYPNRPLPQMLHHDDDAPPWWNIKYKRRLYADGFAVKSARALMQFLLVSENGPDAFRRWEREFQDVAAYLNSLTPPRYPHAVDAELAARGEPIFRRTCAKCHGTYGSEASYPEKIIPIEVVGTDPMRLRALTASRRRAYEASWFAYYGKHKVIAEPGGYVAPPLHGIWASAPYFHNGSVPTLWHVLHPEKRPVVWRRSALGYDQQKVGLEVTELNEVPDEVTTSAERRCFFDTRAKGKSAAGHEFPGVLNEDERRAVLEYLKTL